MGVAEEGTVDGRDADVGFDVEDGSEDFITNDRRGRAFFNNATFMQDHQSFCVLRSLIQVVERHDDGQVALLVQRLDEL